MSYVAAVRCGNDAPISLRIIEAYDIVICCIITSGKSLFLFWLWLVAACLTYLQARWHNFSPETWVARNHFEDLGAGEVYSLCMFWALSSMLALGYIYYPDGGVRVRTL